MAVMKRNSEVGPLFRDADGAVFRDSDRESDEDDENSPLTQEIYGGR